MSSFDELTKRLQNEYGTGSNKQSDSGFEEATRRLREEYSEEKTKERTSAVNSWAERYNSLVERFSDYESSRNGGYTADVSGGLSGDIDSLINDFEGIRGYAKRMGLLGADSYYSYLKDLQGYVRDGNEFMSQFSGAEEYDRWMAMPKREDGSIDYAEMARQAADALSEYERGMEPEASTSYAEQNRGIADVNSYGAAASAPRIGDPKHKELSTQADYYRLLADRERDAAITAANLKELESWSEEDRRLLELVIDTRTGSFGNLLETMGAALSSSGASQKVAYGHQTAAAQALSRLSEKYGEQTVLKLAESLSRSRNQEITQAVTDSAEAGAYGLGGATGSSILSVGANLAGNILAPVGALSEFATSTGQYKTLDPNNLGMVANAYAGQVRETVSGQIEGEDPTFGKKALATVYRGGMSALDNLARIAMTGGNEFGSLALAGTGSFGQTVAEASANGASPLQAAGLGIVSGAAEILTEKMSLDSLLGIAKRAPGSLREVIATTLKQAGTEVIEEEVSLLANTVAEALILQGQNGYRMSIGALMDSGMSYEEAKKVADRELVTEALMTAAESFISGGFMSGPAMITGYASDQNRATRSQYASEAEVRLDELGAEGDLQELARIVARQTLGEELTRGEQKKLSGSEAAQQVAAEFAKNDPLRALAESVAAEQSGAETAQRAAEALPDTPGQANTSTTTTDPTATSAAEQTAQETTQAAPKAQPAQTEIDESWMDDTPEAPVQRKSAPAPAEAASEQGAQKPSRSVSLWVEGKDAEIAGVESIRGGKVTYRLSDGSTVAEEDVVFNNDSDAEVYQTVQSLGISAEEANILLDRYYAGNVNGTVFARGIQNAFTYGRVGMPLQDAFTRSDFVQQIPTAAADFAHRMGAEARKAEAARQQAGVKAKAGQSGVNGKGKVAVKADQSKLSQRQKASISALETVAQALGINIELFESRVDEHGHRVGENGSYDRKTGTIRIDLYAGTDGEGTILFTAAHELTHFIKQWSPEKFDKLADFLVEQYGKGNQSVAELVEEQKRRALEQDITLSDDVAFEEFVADSMEAMLTDGEVLAKLKQHDQSIWEKIRDYITELAAKLKKAYEGLKPDSAEGRYVAQMRDAVAEIQSLFTEALMDAGENYRGAEGQKNTTLEGGERYSLRVFEDGMRFVDVQVEQSRFDGLDESEANRLAKSIIHQRFVGRVIGLENRVFVNGGSASEYVHPSKNIAPDIRAAKMRASGELDNLLDAGRNFRNAPDGADGHIHPDAVGGFDYFDAIFKVGNEYYEGVINITVNKRGKLLKDITKIRNITKDIISSYGENPKSEFLRDASMDSIRNSSRVVNNKSDDDPGTIDAPLDAGQEVLFSLRRDSEFSDNAIRRNQQTGNVPDGTMQKAKGMRERVAARMRQLQYDKRVALPEDIEGNTYIANSSYDGTEENTTVCPRSLASEAFMDAVSEYMGRPLTVDEQIYISQDLQGRTLTPECLYCYVATDRKAYRAFLGNYVQQRDAVIQAYKDGDTDTSRSGSLYQTFLDGRKDTQNMWKRFRMWIKTYESGKPMVQASHLANISKLMGDITGEFGTELKDQIKDAMAYAQSASWAKKRIGYVAYNGHILKWKQDRINKLNSHYGLRMYSFSDFSPAFILENMQMITDAAVRGLKMLGYTKEIDFVKIFAGTGMNINVSTFGFESGGNVYENSIIGAAWDQAKALREQYPNVGITFVATNDTLVDWALNQDWIDVVIPYHLVRTGAEVAKALKYTNYTSESSDTKDAGWQKGVDQKFIAPTEHDNDFGKYMAALKKNHLRPRFERFANRPNYMKLVNETRQPASKSRPVQPVFDEAAINESLAKLAANGYYRPIGDTVDRMYEIAAQVAEDMQHRGDDGRRYSLRRSRELSQTENEAARIFGTTKSFAEAGYLMPDGSMLRFTDDQHGGRREYDHRAIAMAYGEEVDLGKDHGFSFAGGRYLDEFVEAGNIRFDAGEPELGMDIGMQLSSRVPLTKAQEQLIRDLVEWKQQREADFEAHMTEDDFLYTGPLAIRIDFGGDSEYATGAVSSKDLAAWGKKSLEYTGRNISAQQIIHDIRRYYETGETTQRSSLNQFRYSIRPKDSQGRMLTPEQQKFFQNSVIRDQQGRLMVMYHGTLHGGFTEFGGRKDYWYFTNDRKYAYTFEGRKANGHLYPSTKEGIAEGYYTPQRYKVYLNVTNPFVTADTGIVEDALYWDRTLAGRLREQGYDALMLEDMSQVIVLNPNQIKNVDNGNPTEHPDIRYSIRPKDSQGRELSREQMEYFRDSKVRDAQGRLQAVYHGTQSMGFTVFDPAKSDDGISLFFSALKRTARTYSDSYGKEQDTYAIDRDTDLGQFSRGPDEERIRTALQEAGYEVTGGLITDRAEAEDFAEGIRRAYREIADREGGPLESVYKKQMAMELTDSVLTGADGWYRVTAGYLGEELLIDRESAEQIAVQSAGANQGLYEVYLNITNPFVLDCKGREWNDIGYNKLKDGETPHYEGTKTRDVTAWAKANGYDGVIFKNIFDIGNHVGHAKEMVGTDTVYVAFSSEQVKSTANKTPTDDPDIRFSRRDPDYAEAAETVKRENEKLKADVAKLRELLKLQRTVTNGTKFTKTSLEAAAGNLIKTAGAKGPKAELVSLLEEFYAYIAKNEELTWEGVKEAAQPAVDWLMRNAAEQDLALSSSVFTEQGMLREVYDSYWSVSTLKTFADVKQKQINKLRGEHLKRMADMRATHKERVDALKQKHREQLKAVRAEDRARLERKQAELRQQYQQSRKNAMESRHRTEMRHKIQKVVKQLNDLLLHETKDRHVPEDMKKAVAEALELFDMDTVGAEARIAEIDAKIAKLTDPKKIAELMVTRDRIQSMGDNIKARLEALRAAYSKIKTDADTITAAAFDPVVESRLAEAVEIAGNASLRNMSMAQLEAVYDAYKMILKSIRDANKAFKTERQQSIQQMGEGVQEEIHKVGGSRQYVMSALQKVRGFAWNTLKPIYAFRLIGSDTLTGLYEGIRGGEDTWAVDVTEARDFFREQRDRYHYDKWDFDKTYSFESTTGNQFKLSLEQIMSLYAYSKREQADQHLYKGGFVFDSSVEVVKKVKGVPVKYNVNTADAYNLTPEILADIVSSLTDEQKKFVDAMQSYLSDTMGAKGNEVSMELYDIRLFKEKNYFPLRSAKQFLFEQAEAAGEIKLKNSGFTKGTTPKANNPIILKDFMDVWAGHVNDMSMYHAFVLPLENFNRVFNYKSPNTADSDSVSVKNQLQNAYGSQAAEYVKDMLTDLNGGARVDKTAGVMNKLMAAFKKSAVFGSASVVIQQPSAIARAMALIDPKYFVGGRTDAKKHRQMWEEVKRYAPVAIIKEMGYFDTNMGRNTVDFITAKEYRSLGEKAKALFTDNDYRDEFFGKAPALADEMSWIIIWDAVKREMAQQNPGMARTSEEFLKKAGKRFTEVVTKTQVYDSVLSRSAMMRSKDVGMKMATAFMAEPTTTMNMVVDALVQGKRGDKKYAKAAIGAVVASQILNSILVSFVYAARDDDEDETYLEKYMKSFVGKLFDSLNPLAYIPFVKDIVSIVQGYDVERSDMAVISDIYNAWKQLDSETISPWKKVENFVGGIVQLFGVPLKNIMRDARALYQVFWSSAPIASGTNAGLRYSILEGVPGLLGGGAVTNQQQLYDAYLNGDSAHIARVTGRYRDQSAANTALRKALRENDPRIHAAAVARIDGDIREYMRIVEEIKAEGHFSQDLIVGAVNGEINSISNSTSEPTTTTKALSMFDGDDFAVAIAAGDDEVAGMIRDEMVKTYVANGKTEEEAESSFRSAATAACHEQLDSGLVDRREAVRVLMEYSGYDREKAEKTVSEWEFENEFGFDYSERETAYKSGQITREELRQALMQAGGKTAEEAALQIEVYDWEMEVPGCSNISQSVIAEYNEMCKPVGIDRTTYYKAWEFYQQSGEEGVYNSKVKECMPYIDSLDLTDEQKTALALCWWAESTVNRYKLW